MTVRDSMSTNFITFSSQTGIKKAVETIKQAAAAHVIVGSASGEFTVKPLLQLRNELEMAGDRLGPAILKLTLDDIPGLLQPCQPVEAESGLGEAQRKMRRSPGRQTVVVEGGQPVGVLHQATRSVFGGVPSQLYGERYGLFQEGAVAGGTTSPRRCPSCQGEFDFYKIGVAEGAVQYSCPLCGFLFKDLKE
ncbi:MAG: hypothetical protein ACE5NP_08680 [Anaerolineae bacterium]